MKIDVKVDISSIEKMDKLLQQKGPKVIQGVFKRALKAGETAFESKDDGAPAIYKVSKKELSEFVKIKQDCMVISSRLLTTGTDTHFAITPKAYKATPKSDAAPGTKKKKKKRRKLNATATVKKANKESLPHAFIANPAKINGGLTMLWERHPKIKGLIRPIRRVSAAQMAENPEVYEAINKAIQETIDKRLDHEIERLAK